MRAAAVIALRAVDVLVFVASCGVHDLAAEEQGPPFTVHEVSNAHESPSASPRRSETDREAHPTRSLSPEDLSRVLSGLPAFAPLSNAPVPPAVVPFPMPPPRNAGVSAAPLRAVDVPPVLPPGNHWLEVLRRSPEGEVDDAVNLTVSFSEPMAPLAGARELAPSEIPVRITPEVKGSWRWLGTSTLLFEPRDGRRRVRFPRATRFEAEVPAGTRSALGQELKERLAWSFSTPPPRALASYPRDGQIPLEPLFFVVFNQPIDSAGALAFVRLRAGDRIVPVRLATKEEVDAESRLRGPDYFLVRNDSPGGRETPPTPLELAAEGGSLAFRPTEKLPLDSTVVLRIEPGVPALEGGRRMEEAFDSTKDARRNLTTYGPLNVKGVRMWGEGRPRTGFNIDLTNTLDRDAFRPNMVRIEPQMAGLSVDASWSGIEVKGMTRPNTIYHVTLSHEIKDVWGQTLGADVASDVPFGSEPGALWTEGGSVVLLDPLRPQLLNVYSVNEDRFRAHIYKVRPEQLARAFRVPARSD